MSLETILAELAKERAIFALLLRSSRRQHGKTVYFRKLDIAHRHLARTCASCVAESAQEPSAQQVEAFDRVQELLRAAFCEIESLLAQSYFMPFALTALASIARLATLSAHAAISVAQGDAGGGVQGGCKLDPRAWRVVYVNVGRGSASAPSDPLTLTQAAPVELLTAAPAEQARCCLVGNGSDGDDDLGAPVLPSGPSGTVSAVIAAAGAAEAVACGALQERGAAGTTREVSVAAVPTSQPLAHVPTAEPPLDANARAAPAPTPGGRKEEHERAVLAASAQLPPAPPSSSQPCPAALSSAAVGHGPRGASLPAHDGRPRLRHVHSLRRLVAHSRTRGFVHAALSAAVGSRVRRLRRSVLMGLHLNLVTGLQRRARFRFAR